MKKTKKTGMIMRKKRLILFLTFLLAFGNLNVVCAKKAEYSGKCGKNAYWKIKNGVMTVSGKGAVTDATWKRDVYWVATPSRLVIKSGITSIGSGVFSVDENQEDLFEKGISLPNTLKTIGNYAFYQVAIKNLVIPKSVITIGEHAFYDTNIVNLTILGNVKVIGKDAFSYNADLTKATIKGNVGTISEDAFEACWNLPGIKFEGKIGNLEKGAFRNCWSLKEMTIPEGITVIPEQAFMKCLSLERVNLPSTLTTIEKEAFLNCNRMTQCSIPAGVTAIKEGAFNYCARMEQLILPESATTIEKNAFKDCYSLQSVQLPSALQEIPEGMLSGCASLETVTFPESVKKIGKEALAGCSKLETVTIPPEVTQLEAFDQDCPKLKEIVNRSRTEYPLEASGLVKKWYRDGQEVTKAGSGETVTAENRQFRIKYKKEQEDDLYCRKLKVRIKGKKPDTYTYGETVNLPESASIRDYKHTQNFILGWRYECEDKNYQTGRPVTYADTYVKTTDVSTKGNLTISPVIMGVQAKFNKKKQIRINLLEESTVYIPARSYQLNLENADEYFGSASYMKFEIRYATNKKMKNARLLAPDISRAFYFIKNASRKKNYYIQVRPVTTRHPGVPFTYEWSEVVKLKVK